VRDSDTDTADKRSLEARPRPSARDRTDALTARVSAPLRRRAAPRGLPRLRAAGHTRLINNNMFTMSEHSRPSRMDTLHIDIETTDIPSTVQRTCERETKLLFQRQRRFLGRY
jgi:hypothetical protein